MKYNKNEVKRLIAEWQRLANELGSWTTGGKQALISIKLLKELIK